MPCPLPKGFSLRFQVLCPGEFDERIFPSQSGEILGPSGDSFGRACESVNEASSLLKK